MSAKVFKKDSAVALAPFFLPEIGAENPISEIAESFEHTETVDFEPFVEAAREQTVSTPDDILEQARAEAEQIVAQAERDKEIIEQAAHEKAEQEARLKIEAEVLGKTEEIRETFAETIREISVLRDEIAVRAEKDVVELALEIAKKIVGREVAFDREIALTLVKVSLKKINSRAPLAQIHLNPEDFAYIEKRREQIDFRGSLELVEDRNVSPGGCLIHTETGEVDSRIESQFEEIAHGLLGK